MQNLYKIEDHVDLRKDKDNGAILLADKNVANEYRSRKAMMNNVRDVSSEINTIKEKLSELDSVKADMQEIKELLRGLAK
jgi:uncharacterized protein YydD (DUF2326 family)